MGKKHTHRHNQTQTVLSHTPACARANTHAAANTWASRKAHVHELAHTPEGPSFLGKRDDVIISHGPALDRGRRSASSSGASCALWLEGELVVGQEGGQVLPLLARHLRAALCVARGVGLAPQLRGEEAAGLWGRRSGQGSCGKPAGLPSSGRA